MYLQNIGFKLVIDEESKKFIASKGYDIQFGARPLKRAIQTYLEDGLSEIIVNGTISEGHTISVTFDKEKESLVFNQVTDNALAPQEMEDKLSV